MAEVLAKKEELADRLEKANEEAIASAIAEEEQLTREIQAENNDLDTDNESDFSVRIIMLIFGPVCFVSFLGKTDIRFYFLWSFFWIDGENKSSPQASINSGGCGVNMDWSDMLADFDGIVGNI